MTRPWTSSLLLGLLFVSACAAPPPPPPPPPPDTTAADTAAINKLRSDYESAWKAGDVAKLGTLVAPNVTTFDDQQPTASGRDAWIAALKAQLEPVTVGSVSIKSDEMKLLGNYAFDAGTFEATFTPKAPRAKPVTIKQRYIVVLHKEPDGQWRMYRGIDNAVPAPAKK